MACEHVFDRRDTRQTRCLECKQVVNDPGKYDLLTHPLSERMHKLAGYMNGLADSIKTGTIHVWNGRELLCWGFSDKHGWRLIGKPQPTQHRAEMAAAA